MSQRSDLRGWVQVLVHMSALLSTGWIFFLCTENDWWPVAPFVLLIHGTLFSFLGYAGASHELSHHTVFRKKAANIFFLHIFSFLSWGNHAYFSLTHATHHRSTLDPEADIEVPTTKCVSIFSVLVTSIFDVRRMLRTINLQALNACGIFPGRAGKMNKGLENPEAKRRVANAARTILLGHFALVILFGMSGLWQLILLVNISAFTGNGLVNLLASSQHCGLRANILDYRENTRTVILNPVIRLFYWNMNFHVEHHMYPGVPCYNLPRLRDLIHVDLPPATVGLRGIIKVIISDHTGIGNRNCASNRV